MKPIIKWPGGKSREIDKIKSFIPEYDRYIEPFFGGGALFFHLAPQQAAINDISEDLMEYYSLIQTQDSAFYELLLCYSNSFSDLLSACQKKLPALVHLFFQFRELLPLAQDPSSELERMVAGIAAEIGPAFYERLVLDKEEFLAVLLQMTKDKFDRTIVNYNKKPFSTEDLCENLITGFTSGYYMYFRKVFNDIRLKRTTVPSRQYKAANFYFIREYCYGSMFRYNAKGEFNIPYGGMSYNKKDMQSKIKNMFNDEIAALFANTAISCTDFEAFLQEVQPTENDFIFLDPPYDTEFSDYEGNDFTKFDQERLARALIHTPAKFILVIKNTDFIKGLYENHFNILSFDKQYTYNVRSRNSRDAEHLIITNLPV